MAEPCGPVIIDGLAIISFGLVGTETAALAGLGLNTFGLLWPKNAVWIECSSCNDNPTTVWEECDCE